MQWRNTCETVTKDMEDLYVISRFAREECLRGTIF